MTDLQKPEHPPTPPAPEGRPAEPAAEGSSPAKLGILAALLAVAGYFGGLSMVIVILSVVVMIFLHELGHYLAARWAGMKVTEFFIGFGPRIWSFQRGETEYGLKAIPAGAYVRVIGMNSLDDTHDPADEPRTYRQASFPKRFILAVAGSGMHFAQAFIALVVVFAIVGIPGGRDFDPDTVVEPAPVIDRVLGDSAAAAVGLQPGDTILELDGVPVDNWNQFRAEIGEQPNDQVELTILSGGAVSTVQVDLQEIADPDGGTRGSLGVSRVPPERPLATVGPIDAVGDAASDFKYIGGEVFGFLGRFFSPSGLNDFSDVVVNADTSNDTVSAVTGGSAVAEDVADRPMSLVGAVRLGSDITDAGLWGFLLFYAQINITIGIINLMPFPPLDGGHVVVAVYERIREGRRGKRHIIDYRRLIPVAYAMFVLLGLVFVTTTYLDILDAV
ncbi:M50 family metallopeptidase [Actinospongicola halichondriae]|uniref:M50 family metallopeptidase n=1 Tax=Actinospongicola halichondriae TaxID=3236844 RepID=UPI003D5059C8